MKTLIRKIPPNEAMLYGQGVFTEKEELILLSLTEFSKWQVNLKYSLNEALEIVEESAQNKSKHGPQVDARRILNWIRKTRASLEIMENRKQEKKISYFLKL